MKALFELIMLHTAQLWTTRHVEYLLIPSTVVSCKYQTLSYWSNSRSHVRKIYCSII